MINFLSFLVPLCHILSEVHARTEADAFGELSRGAAKVVLGAFLGDIALIKQGLYEGGTPTAILTPFLGESVLKIGTAFEDFPVAPAIHVAISQGTQDNLEAAFFLLRSGASLNAYEFPYYTDAPITKKDRKRSPSVNGKVVIVYPFISVYYSNVCVCRFIRQDIHQLCSMPLVLVPCRLMLMLLL